jgi:AraC-type DNA-binding domain-containing proteins
MDDFTFGGLDVDDGVMIEYAEALLHSIKPERDPLAGQAAALVARITDDPGLRRVDQLAATSGMTPRTLQRLFADYVGVSPKWVMRGPGCTRPPSEPTAASRWLGRAGLGSRLRRPGPPHQGLHRDHRGAAGPLRGRPVIHWDRLSLSSGRPWAPSRAALMSFLTSAGWVRICLGVKRSTTIWYLAIRRPRASVFA